ncbi:MAG: hypothetical protein KGR48_04440 [Alphaproteobacteria bacterium]|nr:hypothetical protein [Alphaproteobacteria bacterium]MBU6471097.1 hypothetical protein [Alphaproteobacteria bacterium]MDE2012542.1 hypothetical protein [Alphaproteobacteria bacterium]MDE2072923.1 hypothetical protein [Alphaproteobacteria bacterium]
MKANRTVLAYAAGVLSTFLAVAAGQAVAAMHDASFDTIDVHRINLREPDGTLRMVISDRAEFPGAIEKGKEYPHPSRNDSAGMIFFNDEGTENGGLIFGGKDVNGKIFNFGHLSFDQYEQDQVLTLEQGEENGTRWAGLSIADRPDKPLDYAALAKFDAVKDGPAKAALLKKLEASGAVGGAGRVFIGKDRKRESRVSLRDADGRARLVLSVAADGTASIAFLDAKGKVVRTIGPGS